MTDPVATVISIVDGRARVEIADRSACPRCAAGKGCGAGMVGSTRGVVALTVRVTAGLTVAAGDRVTLSLAPTDLVRAALFVYGAPLGGLLLFSGSAYLLIDPLADALALGFAIFGLLAGGFVGRTLARRGGCVSRMLPSISGYAGS
ncbi:MAG: SoxR reducing system RseC family protein [Gammaproteobacteria bacterium]|nr:SoxR reducing system RseC family protein [Gammaproteobacteria bacterium]